jgi:hypothetical protein
MQNLFPAGSAGAGGLGGTIDVTLNPGSTISASGGNLLGQQAVWLNPYNFNGFGVFVAADGGAGGFAPGFNPNNTFPTSSANGGNGGTGGQVTINAYSTQILTTGTSMVGIYASASGGAGSAGGQSPTVQVNIASGGTGGTGGKATIMLDQNSSVTTTGNQIC